MSLTAGAIAAIIAASAATAGAGASYGINKANSGKYGGISKQDLLKMLQDRGVDPSVLEEATGSEYEALLNDYYEVDNDISNLWGLWGGDREVLDTERLLEDLTKISKNTPEYPEAPKMDDFINEEALQASMGGRLTELQQLGADRKARFDQEMSDINDDYAGMRRSLLSTQARQDAQLMDTMRSEMSRSRKNALEAGASAGIRLADNINIMLSNQNKQAQTSLETSNQLAQMAINQRAAKSNAQNSYDSYMNQNYQQRENLRQTAYNEASTRYNAAQQDYLTKMDEYNNANASNLSASNMWRELNKRKNVAGNSGMYNNN